MAGLMPQTKIPRPVNSGPAVIHILSAAPAPGAPAAAGMPWPRGVLHDGDGLHVTAPDGRVCPAAHESLVRWPDGSIRWTLGRFLAAEAGAYTVVPGDSPEPVAPVTVTRSGDSVVLANGQVSVEFVTTGPGPIGHLDALGQTLICAPEQFRLDVNEASSLHETTRQITVLSASPLCARLRVAGSHHRPDGSRCLAYRLDVELWAGQPALRLDYGFFHTESGQAVIPIDRIRMQWDWQLASATVRHFLQKNHGIFYTPRDVRNPAPVALVADNTMAAAHVASPQMLMDDVDYPAYLRPPLVSTADWLGVANASRSIYVLMDDFAAMRPKRLWSSGCTLGIDAWPRSAGRLDLPQGRSRRQTVVVWFSPVSAPGRGPIEAGLRAPLWLGRGYVEPGWIRACGEFEQDRMLEPGTCPRFEKFFERLLRIETPQRMFDLGDTPDPGYGQTYPGAAASCRRADAPPGDTCFLSDGKLAPWHSPEHYELVWTNNEYDLIHALASEIMRCGRYEHWRRLARAARHNIEVDFLHFSDDRWRHRASPAHSVDHTTSGAYPSHFWTQGLLAYYCLSGDIDALEVAVALGDKIIENVTDPEMSRCLMGFNREIGWPVLALSYLSVYSGEPRFARQLGELTDYLVRFDREAVVKPVHLSGVDPSRSFHRQIVDSFFGYASMVEGMAHVADHTNDETLTQWLIEFVSQLRDALVAAHREGKELQPTRMHPVAMAIGYELTGDSGYLDAGMVCLHDLLDSATWHSPPNAAKPAAMAYRGLVRFLHHAQQAGLTGGFESRGRATRPHQ